MDEKSKEIILLLAYIYLQQGKFNQALKYYKALRLIYPQDSQIALGLAYGLHETGNNHLSLAEAKLAALLTSKDDEIRLAMLLKSQSLWGLGDKDAARKEMQHYLESKESKEVLA